MKQMCRMIENIFGKWKKRRKINWSFANILSQETALLPFAKLRRVKNALYVQIRVHTVTYISFRFLSPSNAFKGTLLFTIVEWRVTEDERERVWYIG